MRVLAISYLPEEKFSSRQHLGFLRGLEQFCDYTYLFGNTIIRDGMTAQDVEKEYQPDVVIHYDSYAPRGQKVLFSSTFFAGFSCAKVMIEVDFWKRVAKDSFDWYVSNGFDLIIRRGCFMEQDNIQGIPSVWLPFSASDDFYPGDEERLDAVGFTGAYKYSGMLPNGVKGYAQRRKAMELLDAENLLLHCRTCRTLLGSRTEYPKFLRSVIASLTSAETRSPHGKAFEIMASGTVLLTPDFDYKTDLFGSEECFVEYKEDCSDVVEKARKIINEPEWAKGITDRACCAINKLHTHKERIQELYQHLQRILAGRPVLYLWK